MPLPHHLTQSEYPLLKLHAAGHAARLRVGATRVERSASGTVLVRVNLPEAERPADEPPQRVIAQPELRLKARTRIATRRIRIEGKSATRQKAELSKAVLGGRTMRWACLALMLAAELSVGVLLWKQLVENHSAVEHIAPAPISASIKDN